MIEVNFDLEIAINIRLRHSPTSFVTCETNEKQVYHLLVSIFALL